MSPTTPLPSDAARASRRPEAARHPRSARPGLEGLDDRLALTGLTGGFAAVAGHTGFANAAEGPRLRGPKAHAAQPPEGPDGGRVAPMRAALLTPRASLSQGVGRPVSLTGWAPLGVDHTVDGSTLAYVVLPTADEESSAARGPRPPVRAPGPPSSARRPGGTEDDSRNTPGTLAPVPDSTWVGREAEPEVEAVLPALADDERPDPDRPTGVGPAVDLPSEGSTWGRAAIADAGGPTTTSPTVADLGLRWGPPPVEGDGLAADGPGSTPEAAPAPRAGGGDSGPELAGFTPGLALGLFASGVMYARACERYRCNRPIRMDSLGGIGDVSGSGLRVAGG